jgi:hypothetical protein
MHCFAAGLRNDLLAIDGAPVNQRGHQLEDGLLSG